LLPFALSILFYFLGTVSIYASLFKVSINALISSIFGYIAFSSLPKFIPGVVDQAFNIISADISNELPVGFKESIVTVMSSWLKNPIANVNKLFFYIIVVSILTSIVFYFLKKGHISSPAVTENEKSRP